MVAAFRPIRLRPVRRRPPQRNGPGDNAPLSEISRGCSRRDAGPRKWAPNAPAATARNPFTAPANSQIFIPLFRGERFPIGRDPKGIPIPDCSVSGDEAEDIPAENARGPQSGNRLAMDFQTRDLPEMTYHVVASGGIDIAYETVGEGTPVLLIHGFGANRTITWRNTGWLMFW